MEHAIDFENVDFLGVFVVQTQILWKSKCYYIWLKIPLLRVWFSALLSACDPILDHLIESVGSILTSYCELIWEIVSYWFDLYKSTKLSNNLPLGRHKILTKQFPRLIHNMTSKLSPHSQSNGLIWDHKHSTIHKIILEGVLISYTWDTYLLVT